MCIPAVAAGIIAAVASAASAAVTTVGAVTQGVASANAGAAAEDASRLNAAVLEDAAKDAERRGAKEAGVAKMAGGLLAGKQRAAYAGSNVDASSGSAADLQAETTGFAALDAETIRNNAAREAWGLRQNAVDVLAQGKAAHAAGDANAAGSFLGAAGRFGEGVAGGFSAYGRLKAPDGSSPLTAKQLSQGSVVIGRDGKPGRLR